ncbi:cbb3-type cytochrome oxidase assembly protein CcoS [Colwellia sp. 12G3]|uniref:cbb3-type cytochrome oxidase assembly protein CcoS n=1 Tax=Colwellia sp. 12G3 TaxID=2058299 RepID=UPI000C33CBA5|nr:cbb3-type cytochrome oxidase assembly protein CcoS [Colwellia sp. 12G3]PKI16729.1 cbb3-type cytochrome oxidase assembly protein CcoS [Colwellia sp. 12G3]
MSIIYILIPIAILLTSLGIYLFFWAVKTEQFEDLEKQGMSILFDDDQKINTTEDITEQEIDSVKKSSDNQ